MTDFKPFVKYLRPKGPLSNHLLWVAHLVRSASSLENLQRLSLGVNTIAVILIWKLFYFISVWFWQQRLLACMGTITHWKQHVSLTLEEQSYYWVYKRQVYPLWQTEFSLSGLLWLHAHIAQFLSKDSADCLGMVCWWKSEKNIWQKNTKNKMSETILEAISPFRRNLLLLSLKFSRWNVRGSAQVRLSYLF